MFESAFNQAEFAALNAAAAKITTADKADENAPWSFGPADGDKIIEKLGWKGFSQAHVFPSHGGVNRWPTTIWYCSLGIPLARGGEPEELTLNIRTQYVFPSHGGVNREERRPRRPRRRIPLARGGEPQRPFYVAERANRIPLARGGEPTGFGNSQAIGDGRDAVFGQRDASWSA